MSELESVFLRDKERTLGQGNWFQSGTLHFIGLKPRPAYIRSMGGIIVTHKTKK